MQKTNEEKDVLMKNVNKFQNVVCRRIMNGYSWLEKQRRNLEFKWHNWLHGTDLKP